MEIFSKTNIFKQITNIGIVVFKDVRLLKKRYIRGKESDNIVMTFNIHHGY
jgi:hypothetical protein